MRVYSYCDQGYKMTPVEIEVALFPGIPQFVLSGLPDATIRESLIRIQSALRAQGFELPTREKVFINLKPAYEKKKSRGLELAIVCAYLWATKQIPVHRTLAEAAHVYGELGLYGEISYIDDVEWLPTPTGVPILSGVPNEGSSRTLFGLRELRDLLQQNEHELICSPASEAALPSRPPLKPLFWPKSAADALAILALGEHHGFLAGPAGTGKTTFAESLYGLLNDLNFNDWNEIRFWHRGQNLSWRPMRAPHHLTTPQAIIGGGNPPEPGEITKAHRGLLFLDEFLEFPSHVREALREPLESGEITVSRKGNSEKFQANFQLLAASNLCPCGDYVPKTNIKCANSLIRCRSYLEKLSGPLLDRFDIMVLTHKWQSDTQVSTAEILSKVQAARAQIKKWQRKPAAHMTEAEIMQTFKNADLIKLMPTTTSRRRGRALLRVARTLADLRGSVTIEMSHLDEAAHWALNPFLSMR